MVVLAVSARLRALCGFILYECKWLHVLQMLFLLSITQHSCLPAPCDTHNLPVTQTTPGHVVPDFAVRAPCYSACKNGILLVAAGLVHAESSVERKECHAVRLAMGYATVTVSK